MDELEDVMQLWIQIYTFIVGALIGSFLNVVVYRVPREESISFPPSHCPHCQYRLKVYDLVPMFSYLILKGRCRNCGEKISLRYPIVEAVSGFLFLFTLLTFGLTWQTLQYVAILSILLAIFLIDYDHMIIPDGLNLGVLLVAIVGFVLSVFLEGTPWGAILDPVLGLLLGGGLFLFIAVVTHGAMGGGDIKLMGALGFLFGVMDTLMLIFFSFTLGGLLSVLLIALKIKKRKDYIPFGPFICLAAAVTIFWGDAIYQWYFSVL